ncbi:cold-shock protein [Paracoccus sp. S-4012]|uniref:TfoX/Sxy family protein n=1 Tax=Paracoccus sp. S-4012 TaxID=2665648 RepID=UPI0012AF52EB|nr:TfoX/Sxy family protein [Paracoccus sp. S-4012]MRX51231.1 cold-shock protein [Paracoccus sp. S-4012]
MPRDPGIEQAFREELAARLPMERVSERPMFGGLCFMLDGNMVGGASDRGAMLRVGRAAEAEALALPGVAPMIHGGRAKPDYVRIGRERFGEAAARRRLMDMAVACVSALPPKEAT